MTSALRLTTADVDERIAAVRTVLDRTTARLVELDADVTRRLLETTQELRGATAAAWDDAARRHAALWEGQLALERLLERMAHERGVKKSAPQWVLVRLDALLQGAFVELPRPGESGPPRLTEQTAPTVSCSVNEAFDRMSADFDVVTQFLSAVAEAWGETTERLHRVGAQLAVLDQGSQAAGLHRPNDLDPLTRALARGRGHGAARSAVARPGPRDPVGGEGPTAAGRRGGGGSGSSSRERKASGGGARHQEPPRMRWPPVGSRLTRCRRRSSCPRRRSRRSMSWSGTSSASTRNARRPRTLASGPLLRSCAAAAPVYTTRSPVWRPSRAPRWCRRDELRGLLAAYRAKAVAVELAENAEIETLRRAAEQALLRRALRRGRCGGQNQSAPACHPSVAGGAVMTPCERPGCTGQIDSGYCDVCGYPPAVDGCPRADSGTSGRKGRGRSGAASAETVRDRHATGPWRAATATSAAWPLRGPAGGRTRGARGPRSWPAARHRAWHPASTRRQRRVGTSTVRRLSTTSAASGRSAGTTASGGIRGNLGAGLVEVPSVPYRDPQSVLLVDPEVPERKRFCAYCENPVGRSRGSRPARTEGFCPH